MMSNVIFFNLRNISTSIRKLRCHQQKRLSVKTDEKPLKRDFMMIAPSYRPSNCSRVK